MAKFRKKPVIIEAIKWNGENIAQVHHFCEDAAIGPVSDNCIEIITLEGIMKANVGDWIIQGVNGEFYPCKPDIFEKTYEEVTNED